MIKNNILLLLLLLFSTIVIAQQKKYVSYAVKKGETIKSIARDYDITTRDLLRLNPGVKRKPNAETVIIVPNKNFGKEDVVAHKLKTYLVKPKETLFGISRKFGVTIEALKTANPALKDGLKIDMKLLIPEPSITQLKDSVDYILHRVVKDDTSYNLTKRFEVSETDLLRLNPALKDGLKLGMLLKIKPVIIDELDDSEANSFKEELDLSKEINVVLMLPYQINKFVDSTRNDNFEKSNSLLNIVTDFHLGASMAIDSLRRKGLRINVNYLDTENSKYKLQYLINSNDFSNVDVVVGPLYYENAHWISKHIDVPVISPVYSKKQQSLSAGNLIKSSPNTTIFENRLLAYMEQNYNGENVVIINDKKPESQSKLWRIVNKIKAFDSIQTISVLKPDNGFIDSELVMEKLDSLSSNWVFLISDETVTTAAAVNNLKGFAERIDIDLFALNKGKNFDKIDNIFLGKLNFIFPSAEFLNVDAVPMRNFYKAYERKNHALPSKYSIRGFDIMYDTMARIGTFKNLESGLKKGESSRLSATFNYKKKLFGSFENHGVYLIQYTEDLTPVLLEVASPENYPE
jgi:LysM repeat protein